MKFATILTDRQIDGINLPDFGNSTTQHGKTQHYSQDMHPYAV